MSTSTQRYILALIPKQGVEIEGIQKQDPRFPILLVSDPAVGLKTLQEFGLKLCAIFVHQNFDPAGPAKWAASTLRYRPGVPLFLMNESIQEKSLLKTLIRPFRYSRMLEIALPIILPIETFPEGFPGAFDDPPAVSKDGKFISVSAANFLSSSESIFEIFIEMGSGRHVRVLESQDSFTPDRIEAYLKKGLHRFSILKSAHLSWIGRFTNTRKQDWGCKIKEFVTLQGVAESIRLQAEECADAVLQRAHKVDANLKDAWIDARVGMVIVLSVLAQAAQIPISQLVLDVLASPEPSTKVSDPMLRSLIRLSSNIEHGVRTHTGTLPLLVRFESLIFAHSPGHLAYLARSVLFPRKSTQSATA